jgi:hypothetical protein
MKAHVRQSDVARVTLTLPARLWEDVKRLAPAGKRAQLVAQALEAEVSRRERAMAFERAREYGDALVNKYGELPGCVDDINQMREERDAEVTGLR